MLVISPVSFLNRYKCELERSQQALITGDSSFSGTPQKNLTAPLTPVQSHNGKGIFLHLAQIANCQFPWKVGEVL